MVAYVHKSLVTEARHIQHFVFGPRPMPCVFPTEQQASRQYSGNVPGAIEVTRHRMVKVDLHSSSKWSFFSSPSEPCIFCFSAKEELWCSEPVFMALKNLPVTEPQGPEFLSVALRSHLIQVFEIFILHLMPRFRLRQFHYNIKSTGLCNLDSACFLRSITYILCRVCSSAY